MGVARGTIKLLMLEGKREPFTGKILTIGKQDVYATSEGIRKWAKELNYQLKIDVKMTLANNKALRAKACVSDEVLFLSLGFDRLDSMDYSDYEKCTIVHDLNNDIPERLFNHYDLILDGGSSEHIFNIPKVFESYNKMLKVGGRIIHILPSSNYVDHGFYCFSPTLFYDYYSANKWEIIDIFFIRQPAGLHAHIGDVYRYKPGGLDPLRNGGLEKGMYGLFVIVKKTKDSTFNAPVQQYLYTKHWHNNSKVNISWMRRWMKKIWMILPEWFKEIVRHQMVVRVPLRFYLKRIGRY